MSGLHVVTIANQVNIFKPPDYIHATNNAIHSLIAAG